MNIVCRDGVNALAQQVLWNGVYGINVAVVCGTLDVASFVCLLIVDDDLFQDVRCSDNPIPFVLTDVLIGVYSGRQPVFCMGEEPPGSSLVDGDAEVILFFSTHICLVNEIRFLFPCHMDIPPVFVLK